MAHRWTALPLLILGFAACAHAPAARDSAAPVAVATAPTALGASVDEAYAALRVTGIHRLYGWYRTKLPPDDAFEAGIDALTKQKLVFRREPDMRDGLTDSVQQEEFISMRRGKERWTVRYYFGFQVAQTVRGETAWRLLPDVSGERGKERRCLDVVSVKSAEDAYRRAHEAVSRALPSD